MIKVFYIPNEEYPRRVVILMEFIYYINTSELKGTPHLPRGHKNYEINQKNSIHHWIL
jgi:hypothetical protein